jgi:hypothetical protein
LPHTPEQHSQLGRGANHLLAQCHALPGISINAW